MSISEQAAFSQSLKVHSTTLPYSELVEKLKASRLALGEFDSRRAALRNALTTANAEAEARSAALLIEHPHGLPVDDALYRSIVERAGTAREQLLALAEEESKLKLLVQVLNDEIRARDSRLEIRVQTACYSNWKGRADECIESARRAVAAAIIAHCYERTVAAEPIDPGRFFEAIIDRHAVAALVAEIAAQERVKVKADILKRDRMYG